MARDDDYDDDDELEEAEVVSFKGPLNGKEIDPEENKRLMIAGMRPLKELVSDAVARRSELIKIDSEGAKVVVSFFVDGIKRGHPSSGAVDGPDKIVKMQVAADEKK